MGGCSGGGRGGACFAMHTHGPQRHGTHASPPTQKASTRCKRLCTLLDLCVSSLRRGHANLFCIVPILSDDPRRESVTLARCGIRVCCKGVCCAVLELQQPHMDSLRLEKVPLGARFRRSAACPPSATPHASGQGALVVGHGWRLTPTKNERTRRLGTLCFARRAALCVL